MNLHLGSSPDPKISCNPPLTPFETQTRRSEKPGSTISQMGIKMSPNFATLTHQLGSSWEPGHKKRRAWARVKEGTCSQPPGLELQTSAGEEQEGFFRLRPGLGDERQRSSQVLWRSETLPLLKKRLLGIQDAEAGHRHLLREQPESVLSAHSRDCGKRRWAQSGALQIHNRGAERGEWGQRPWSLRLCVGGWSILE